MPVAALSQCTFTKALQHRSDAPHNHVALGIYEHPLTRPAHKRSSAPETQCWRQTQQNGWSAAVVCLLGPGSMHRTTLGRHRQRHVPATLPLQRQVGQRTSCRPSKTCPYEEQGPAGRGWSPSDRAPVMSICVAGRD